MASYSVKELSAVHPITLGLALNHSFFFYEVLNDQEQACNIAKETLDLANKELPRMEEDDSDECRDALGIINLLRENLEMWKIEAEDQ